MDHHRVALPLRRFDSHGAENEKMWRRSDSAGWLNTRAEWGNILGAGRKVWILCGHDWVFFLPSPRHHLAENGEMGSCEPCVWKWSAEVESTRGECKSLFANFCSWIPNVRHTQLWMQKSVSFLSPISCLSPGRPGLRFYTATCAYWGGRAWLLLISLFWTVHNSLMWKNLFNVGSKCFFFFSLFFDAKSNWGEKLHWSELIYLCCLWSLLCLLLLMLNVNWSCNVTAACCYVSNRTLQLELMLLLCFNPLKESSFMNLSESLKFSRKAPHTADRATQTSRRLHAEQPLLVYFSVIIIIVIRGKVYLQRRQKLWQCDQDWEQLVVLMQTQLKQQPQKVANENDMQKNIHPSAIATFAPFQVFLNLNLKPTFRVALLFFLCLDGCSPAALCPVVLYIVS